MDGTCVDSGAALKVLNKPRALCVRARARVCKNENVVGVIKTMTKTRFIDGRVYSSKRHRRRDAFAKC